MSQQLAPTSCPRRRRATPPRSRSPMSLVRATSIVLRSHGSSSRTRTGRLAERLAPCSCYGNVQEVLRARRGIKSQRGTRGGDGIGSNYYGSTTSARITNGGRGGARGGWRRRRGRANESGSESKLSDDERVLLATDANGGGEGIRGRSPDNPWEGELDTLSPTCPLPMRLETEGDLPYAEASRRYRRTVYRHDDWLEHRSPTRRGLGLDIACSLRSLRCVTSAQLVSAQLAASSATSPKRPRHYDAFFRAKHTTARVKSPHT